MTRPEPAVFSGFLFVSTLPFFLNDFFFIRFQSSFFGVLTVDYVSRLLVLVPIAVGLKTKKLDLRSLGFVCPRVICASVQVSLSIDDCSLCYRLHWIYLRTGGETDWDRFFCTDFAQPSAMQFIRNHSRKSSELRIFIPPFNLALKIEGPLGLHQRRALVLLVFRQLKPLFRSIEHAYFRHFDGHSLSWVHAEERGISLHQSLCLEQPPQKLGFFIRMKRLELGLTQKQLSNKCHMPRTHLSALEHGKHWPQIYTLYALAKSLQVEKSRLENLLYNDV